MSRVRSILRPIFRRIGPHHVTALLLGFYLAQVLLANQFDPFALIHIGREFDPALGVTPMGYDGQFAYQIALEPFAAAPRLDIPAYRYQRILYPLAARALAMGRPAWIPWTLLLINLCAVPLGTWATARLLSVRGHNRWFSLAYPLNVGMLLAVRLDLNEPLAFLFVQIGYWCWLTDRPWRSAISFALAALTKEVTLIFGIGFVLALISHQRWRRAVLWGTIAFVPFAAWQLILRWTSGTWGLRPGGALASTFSLLPYRNWWSLVGYDLATFLTVSLVLLPLAIMPAAIGLFLGVRALLRGAASGPAFGLTLQSLVYPFLPASNLLDPLGVSRFNIGLIAALLAFGAHHRERRVLAYTQLWIMTLPFALGDNFVPGH